MVTDNAAFYRHNIRIYYIFEAIRALVFAVAVWVLYQRQYISASQYVFIEGLILGIQLLMELPTGAFADLVSRKVSVALGYAVNACAIFFMSFATTFPQFLLFAILYGLGESFISGSREALLYDTFKQAGKEDNFKSMSARFTVVFQISLSIATLVGGLVGLIYLRLPLWMYAVSQGLSSIIALWFIEPYVDSAKFTLRNYIRQTKQGVKEILKTSYIKTMSLYYILVGSISWACMLVFNNTLLVDLGYNPQEIGITMSAARVLNSLVLFRLINVSAWFDKKTSLLFFPVVMILSLAPGVLFTKWMVFPFIMGSMIASTGRWVILGKYVNEEFESKNRATANSTLSMAIGIIYIFLTIASGPIMENFGGTKTVFTLLGILSMVTVLPLSLHLVKNHSN